MLVKGFHCRVARRAAKCPAARISKESPLCLLRSHPKHPLGQRGLLKVGRLTAKTSGNGAVISVAGFPKTVSNKIECHKSNFGG